MPRKRYQRKRKVVRRRRVHRKKNKMNKIQSYKVKSPGVICPDRYLVKLRYIDEHSFSLVGASFTYGYLRYYMNGLADPNPLVLTNPVQGFSELANLYNQFRVNGSKVELIISNMEAFPVIVILIPSNFDMSSYVTSANQARTLMGNPYCKYKVLSAKGGIDKATIKSFMTCQKIAGTNQTRYDVDYTGITTGLTGGTNPPKLLYWNVATYSLGGQAFTSAGVLFDCRITYYSQFFGRVPLAS